MARSARGGRLGRMLGIWIVCVLMVFAIGPFGARTAAARANPGGSGIQRAQVEIDDDEDDEEDDADEADEDQDDEDDGESEPGVYVSPTFGYVLEYDPDVWEVADELSDEFGDWLQLLNGPSFVSLSGTDVYGGDPGDCLDAWEESLEGGDGVEDFEPLDDDDGDPIADEDDESAHAAWVFSSDDGDEIFDVTCTVLIEDEATLTVVLETFEDQYDDQLEELEELLEGLNLSDVEDDTGGRQADDEDEDDPDEDDDTAAGGAETITDDFEDEDDGVFSTESAEPDLVEYRYDDGEYVIETLDPDAGVWQVQLNGPYADVEIAVDVRLEGRTAGRFVKIGCRFDRLGDGFQEYSLVLDPDAQRVLLYRSDGEDLEVLADEDDFDAINPDDETNRLELSCVGETISAAVNGEEVAEVDDDSHAEGAVYLGAGTYADVSGMVEAHFDNLEVTILGSEGDEGDEGDEADDDDDVIVEEFEDEDGGLIRASESDLARYSYDDGEFVMEWLPADDFGSAVISFFPSADGAVADVIVAIDARLVGESGARAILVGCREGAGPDGGTGAYRLMVEPDARAVTLFRLEAAEPIVLANETRVGAVEQGEEINRVELSCFGETIEASVNDEVVISVEDDSLKEGAISLGVEVGSDEPGPAEVRWDNLEVRIAG